MNINHLSLSWSVSRGQDTYGYNICRLDSRDSGKRYKCMGGGYDMIGTVFGEWLVAEHQEALQALFAKYPAEPYALTGWTVIKEFYGMFKEADGNIRLDGGCGIESMIRIAEATGLEVEREYQKTGRNRGNTFGWFVCVKEGA